MSSPNSILVFHMNQQRYGVQLALVQRVVRMVAVTPLPRAPELVLGLVNVHGQIVPVFNVRKRLGMPERALEINDQLILARTAKRLVALAVDQVQGVLEQDWTSLVPVEPSLSSSEFIAGVMKCKDGLILIHNLERFLSLEEEATLENALQQHALSFEP